MKRKYCEEGEEHEPIQCPNCHCEFCEICFEFNEEEKDAKS